MTLRRRDSGYFSNRAFADVIKEIPTDRDTLSALLRAAVWTKHFDNGLVETHFTEEDSNYLIDFIFKIAGPSIIFHFVEKEEDDEKQLGANAYSAFHTAVEACNFTLIQNWCTLENMGRLINNSRILYSEFHAANENHVPEGSEEVPWTATWTPSLFWIVDKCDHEGIVQTILRTPGIDLNIRNENGETPLMYAVKHNNRRTVEIILLEVGVDVYATDIHGKSAMRLALENENPVIIDMMRIATFTPPKRYSTEIDNMLDAIFTSADSIRNVEVVFNEKNVKCLRKWNDTRTDEDSTDVKRTKFSDEKTFTNSLPFEIYNENVETYRDRDHFVNVLRLGCHRKWGFDQIYPANRFESRELLCGAVQLFQQDLVEYIVLKDPTLIFECNRRRYNGSAFQESLLYDNVAALKCFTKGDDDAGAKINRDRSLFRDADGRPRRWATTLWAARECEDETVRVLFEVEGISTRDHNDEGQTALMICISRLKISSIDQILKLGCDLSFRDINGSSSLNYAQAINIGTTSPDLVTAATRISSEREKVQIIEMITSAMYVQAQAKAGDIEFFIKTLKTDYPLKASLYQWANWMNLEPKKELEIWIHESSQAELNFYNIFYSKNLNQDDDARQKGHLMKVRQLPSGICETIFYFLVTNKTKNRNYLRTLNRFITSQGK